MDEILQELQDSPTPVNASTEAPAEQTPADKTVPYGDFEKVYARAKKAEEELKSLKGKQGNRLSDDEIEEVINIRMDGHSREELEYMRAVARHQNKRLPDVVNDPFIQAGIRGMREQAKSQQATPAPSSRPAVTSSAQQKPFSSMNDDERRAHFEVIRQRTVRVTGRSNE